ncbi:hypothetical protein [Vibrio alginolyticus]|uniref:hypothetical protein n=1 Tax=Vibrio alginolyticus TaxID=663 RepID=UPI001BD39D61|nr:hypothetical protein [Vibrio alginolyticus]EJN3360498.1 hypothetical protein [Vibrio alginolyticus]MBT0091746.1 hypothetical protein [Vibrio alginolyticus]
MEFYLAVALFIVLVALFLSFNGPSVGIVKKSVKPGVFYFHSKTFSIAFDEVHREHGEIYFLNKGEITSSIRCGWAVIERHVRMIEKETNLSVKAC